MAKHLFLAGRGLIHNIQDTKCHIHHHFAFIRSFFRLASVCDDEAHRCDSEFGVSERDRNEWVSQTEPHWWKKKRQNAITAWSLPYSSYIHTSAWSFCVSYMSRLFSLWLAVSPLLAHSESGRGVIFGLIRKHSPGGYRLSVQPRALNVCNHITRPDKVTTTLLSSINSDSQKIAKGKREARQLLRPRFLSFLFFFLAILFTRQ